MKSRKTAGLLAILLALTIYAACLPARSAENTILYVRNQPYTQPSLREGGDIYASLRGLLKALRFGWQVSGTSVTLLPVGAPGPMLSGTSYSFTYRGHAVEIPIRLINGEPWVSVRALARAIGAGYQVNDDLHLAEVYFVAAAVAATPPPAPSIAPVAAATPETPVAETPAAPAAPKTPAGTPNGPAKPPAPGKSAVPAPAIAVVPSATATEAAAPSPSPTPQPDVQVSRNTVVADMANGNLVVTIEVTNPADVAANNVVVHAHLVSGEGVDLGNQDLYFNTMAPHQVATQTFTTHHPDGTSMPRSLYSANTTVTFSR